MYLVYEGGLIIFFHIFFTEYSDNLWNFTPSIRKNCALQLTERELILFTNCQCICQQAHKAKLLCHIFLLVFLLFFWRTTNVTLTSLFFFLISETRKEPVLTCNTRTVTDLLLHLNTARFFSFLLQSYFGRTAVW